MRGPCRKFCGAGKVCKPVRVGASDMILDPVTLFPWIEFRGLNRFHQLRGDGSIIKGTCTVICNSFQCFCIIFIDQPVAFRQWFTIGIKKISECCFIYSNSFVAFYRLKSRGEILKPSVASRMAGSNSCFQASLPCFCVRLQGG